MGFYKTEGMLLRRHNLGEADRILTILSPELGKIRVVAKGVRRGKSKMAGHLEPFVVTKLHVVQGRNLDIITSAQGDRYYRLASNELEALALAHLLLEVCDKVLAEREPHPEAYTLLQEALAGIEAGESKALVRHYFFVKLLDCLGHRPELDFNPSEGSDYYLSLENGTLSLRPYEDQVVKVGIDTLKLWRLIYANSLEQVSRIRSAAALAEAAQPIMEQFYRYQLGVKFFSETMLA